MVTSYILGKKEFVPQVLKQVVNLSCYLYLLNNKVQIESAKTLSYFYNFLKIKCSFFIVQKLFFYIFVQKYKTHSRKLNKLYRKFTLVKD